MGFRIARIEIDSLSKSRKPGIKIIFLVIDDPECQPCLLRGGIEEERFLEMLFCVGSFSKPKLCRAKVCPGHRMGGRKFGHFLKIVFCVLEVVVSKIGYPSGCGALSLL